MSTAALVPEAQNMPSARKASSGGGLWRYLLIRFLLIFPTIFILVTLVFVLMRTTGDPITAAVGGHVSQAELAARIHAAGYDRPIIVQYLEYLGQVFTGNFGTTISTKRPVLEVLATYGPATFELAFYSLLVAFIVGIPLGMLAAYYRDKVGDAALRIFAILFYATPVFFVGLLLKLIFSVWLGWLPISGRASTGAELELAFLPNPTGFYTIDAIQTGDPAVLGDVLAHAVLPSVALGLLTAGIFLRLVRTNVIGTLSTDYVDAGRSRGVSEFRLVRKHAYRPALIPIITVIGLQIALLLGGAVLTETTFEWNGLGFQLIEFIKARDYVAVQAIVVLLAVIVAVTNFVVDIIAAAIDPASEVLIMSATATPVTRPSLWGRLPVVHQVRQSVGVQRFMLVTGLVITTIFVFTAIFAPILAPYRFNQLRDASGPFGSQQPPSTAHIMGTTVGGYDVFSRVIWGAQTAILVIILSLVLSIFIGVILGLLSGYFGGWLDRVLVVIADAVYAFPSLLLAIVMAIVISGGKSDLLGGILAAAISISVVYIPQYFRVIRAETVRIKAEAYVEAARVVGASNGRIMFVHVLRNVTRTLPLIVTLNSSEAILTLAALGFIGFGIEPTSAAEWGYDLNKSVADVTSGIWWTSIFPGLAIALSVLGITLVGESLNDLADPRLRGRRAVAKASGSVAETSVVPGGTLDDHGIGIDGLESPQSFDDDGIEVKS